MREVVVMSNVKGRGSGESWGGVTDVKGDGGWYEWWGWV